MGEKENQHKDMFHMINHFTKLLVSKDKYFTEPDEETSLSQIIDEDGTNSYWCTVQLLNI